MMENIVKQRRIKVALLILLIILMVVMLLMFHPLARPSSFIRSDMLEHTPIGTHVNEVIRFIDSNPNWQRSRLIETRGVTFRPHTGNRRIPHNAPTSSNPDFPDVGSQTFRVSLGYYTIILRVFVTLHYAFDEDGYLIDIFIHRELDLI